GVSHKFPKEILVGLNDRKASYHDVYRINIETGEKKLIEQNDSYAGFMTDDDYNVRFAFKFADDGGNLVLTKDDKGEWKEYTKIPMADTLTTNPVGFDKSGKNLYLIDSRGRDTGALVSLDIASGKTTLIAEDKRCDCGGVMMHPTEYTVQAVAFNYERTKWEPKDKDVAEDLKTLAKVADGEVSIASRTLDDKQWTVSYVMDNGPVRYYHYDRESKKARFLFTNRKELEDQPLQKMH